MDGEREKRPGEGRVGGKLWSGILLQAGAYRSPMVDTFEGRRSDKGWKDRGWYFSPEELASLPSLQDNV